MEILERYAPWLLTPAGALSAIVAASVIALGGALASQYFGGLAPCILCLYQRVPYAAVIALGLLALVVPRYAGWALGLAAMAFLVGGGIAVFHVGVEQLWWEGTQSCTGDSSAAASVDALRAQIMEAPVVRCDEVQWSLFGISMAGYNVLASAVLAVFSLMAAARIRTRNEIRET